MPTDFFVNQPEYSALYQENAEIEAEFNALDLTTYSSFGNDTAEYEYSSYEDAPDAPQWQTQVAGRIIEVWWGPIPYIGTTPSFEVRDTEIRNFLGYEYPVMLERANLIINGEALEAGSLNTYTMEAIGIEDNYNATIEVQASYIRTSLIIRANDTMTLGESFTAGVLQYSISYEIDFDAMKPSAWLLIGQLLTFQNPDFGLPDELENIIGYGISLGIYIVVALIAYTIITKLIPTIQGGLEN